ncbi:hypothetical protein HPP92_008663 [Vanilla planifolia]|uniref:Glycosyltransferase n=1 Tax=Vanilla planifolia TaxID=51239 RepID=A0A835V260_VANPL|nr:hypothetical protein HPP92_008663 [Vanilla planifolia]
MDAKRKPHLVLVPFMAQGHMIPAVDMASLLAVAGTDVTFITTPVNAARIRPAIDRVESAGLSIRFVEINFPTAEAGLPAGLENIDLITSADQFLPFMESLSFLKKGLKLHLLEANPAPDCIIFDSLSSWAADVAQSLGLPHLIFYGPSCFFILCSILLKRSQVLDTIADDSETFVIPGLPQTIEVTKAQVERWLDGPEWEKVREEIYAADASADGVLINTFNELETWCLEILAKEKGKKVWPIGPLCLYNKDVESRATRGKASSIDTQLLLSWLDDKETGSVFYVSFGSLSRNTLLQLVEIGLGLEAAKGAPFIWVVKEAEEGSEAARWIDDFEERTKERGMVIRGWAPQAVILWHPAVGGFMTHCGWNSTLEAVSAGVPMVTWPRFGDQFLNERLVVDVLKVGVAVGAKVPTLFMKEISAEAPVKGEDVKKAVERLMGSGEEAEERRARAKEYGEKARRAMEDGGSSVENLKQIIHYATVSPKNKVKSDGYIY